MRETRVMAAALAALAGVAGAQTTTVVVPGVWAGGEAPSSSPFPFAFSGAGIGRYQQVYDAVEFAPPSTPVWVSGVAFRANQNAALDGRTLTVRIALSTTTAAPDGLSPTFSMNVGPDETVVFDGDLTLPPVPASAGPAPFAWEIAFERPFRYAGGGNVLLDLTITASTAGSGGTLDAVNLAGDSVSRAYHSSNPSSPTASAAPSTLGLVTRFDLVPASFPLEQSHPTISVATGGTDRLFLDAGVVGAFRPYVVVGTESGSTPGTTLPGGLHVPINPDPITLTLLELANTPTLPGFYGALDPLGRAVAEVNATAPMDPTAVGRVFTFAFLVFAPLDFASNPVTLSFVP